MSDYNLLPKVARSSADLVDALRASSAYDMTVDPALHHDLLDHGLQTAAVLRTVRPDDIDLQLAGLAHDIGHILAPHADDVHGDLAADFVRPLLGDRAAELIRLHVPAKRYLVTVDTSYNGQLAADSAETLVAQGGPMSSDEVADFERHPLCDDAIELRRADEAAKIPGLDVAPLEFWIDILQST